MKESSTAHFFRCQSDTTDIRSNLGKIEHHAFTERSLRKEGDLEILLTDNANYATTCARHV